MAPFAGGLMKDTPKGGTLWFFGQPFTNWKFRWCHVCGNLIKPGAPAVANHELRKCAHLGCGGIDRRGR